MDTVKPMPAEMEGQIKLAIFAGATGEWGGASRVLFTNLRKLDRTRFAPLVLLPGPGPAESLLDEMGIPYRIWGALTEPGRPIAYLAALVRALALLKREQIAVMHMNRANDWRPAEILAARLCRVPVIYHLHTVNQDRSPATRAARLLMTVSNFVREASDLQGVPAVVIHNCVDMTRFAAPVERQEAGRGGTVRVSFIGQIRSIKGIEDFVAMAGRLPGSHYRFEIYGRCRHGQQGVAGAYSEESLIQLICNDERIIYKGYESAIECAYRSTDILVVPSRWQEPFGLVLIEAAASGVPVVATRCGGIPEVVLDGQTGFLVDAGDIDAMAQHVRRLAEEPDLRHRIGQQAMQHCKDTFAELPVRKMEACYARLAQKRGPEGDCMQPW